MSNNTNNNMHTVHTSTACLHHFIFRGFYEAYAGEQLSLVDPAHTDDAIEAIGKLVCEHLKDAFEYIFPTDIYEDFGIKYERMYSPRFYNFETDSVEFEFTYYGWMHNWMCDYAYEHRGEFEKFLADNYTSRDGFISYTANNFADWHNGWLEDDFRCISALLCFMIGRELEEEFYNYNFDEAVMELIYENFIDSEYACRYDNGYTAVVRGEYDDETCEDYFDCWMLDENNNVVNYIRYEDPWNELCFSGYAAFNNVEYALTKKYHLTGTRSAQCNAPEFDDTIKNVAA